MNQTNEKLATLQSTLERRVQRAREEIQEEIRVLQQAAARIAEDPCANLGYVVTLAISLRNRATLIEQAALRAQDAQETLADLKDATK